MRISEGSCGMNWWGDVSENVDAVVGVGWYADGGMMIAVVVCRQRPSSSELFDVL